MASFHLFMNVVFLLFALQAMWLIVITEDVIYVFQIDAQQNYIPLALYTLK